MPESANRLHFYHGKVERALPVISWQKRFSQEGAEQKFCCRYSISNATIEDFTFSTVLLLSAHTLNSSTYCGCAADVEHTEHLVSRAHLAAGEPATCCAKWQLHVGNSDVQLKEE